MLGFFSSRSWASQASRVYVECKTSKTHKASALLFFASLADARVVGVGFFFGSYDGQGL